MKRIKAITSSLVLMGVIMMGASSAKAGLIMHDLAPTNDTCVEQTKEQPDKVDNGIIVHDLIDFGTAIFESIFGKSDVQTNCGIIVHD